MGLILLLSFLEIEKIQKSFFPYWLKENNPWC